MENMNRVLVIDDDASIRESLEMYLQDKGLAVQTAETGNDGFKLCLDYNPQVVILDIRLPDVCGLDILRRIVETRPDAKVIMITAYHDMESSIEAMRYGAYDYIRKPLSVRELDRSITKSLHISKASLASPHILNDTAEQILRNRIVGDTKAMRSIFKSIGLLSGNRATVLIEGETGTGKELLARVVHGSSLWKNEPFITIDCTTLVETLFESELFGYKKGAFTGAAESKKGRIELAGSGTLFFDEVGELPLASQAKLLRFLEYGDFTRVGGNQPRQCQARIIAATNRNLKDLVKEGLFRQDLFFRLKVITIHVPPLRERISDLSELVRFFLVKINQDLSTKVAKVEKQAMAVLKAHSWPGNVRELKNVLMKAVLESRGTVLMADAVEAALAGSSTELPDTAELKTLEEVEKEYILMALSRCGGNISTTAKVLGISRPTLRKRLSEYHTGS
ncbi:sigma-54-dependent transcriptional regulator [Desulfomonile tiedjei]|uniref:DNA-binding transcriptional regulator NtrC n=1 Tax=Desulfomonile tiedjei (strain ATCC 49306 / DSM 6799 / DCB-1) TaxID=706587 RepID=I4C236_DESTA|nr:sigma-54 dependent transcriptional regulator [Desulfomonile tiedjei]AFM23627.1 response regulator with CheY-like receiver, AAA-type ATPase, and DNA-binding domains [Desulfomonile tiedjei DSM 6799]